MCTSEYTIQYNKIQFILFIYYGVLLTVHTPPQQQILLHVPPPLPLLLLLLQYCSIVSIRINNSYMSNVYREIYKRQYYSPVLTTFRCHSHQWSFRKTGTMGTLASRAEIGVSVQALRGSGGITPRKKLRLSTQNHATRCIFGVLNGNARSHAFPLEITPNCHSPKAIKNQSPSRATWPMGRH